MKLFKDRNGIYKVRFKTQHGWRELTTGQRDERKAKEVVALAKIHQIELAGRAGIMSVDAMMNVVTGRKISTGEAFTAWSGHLSSITRSLSTQNAYTGSVRAFLAGINGQPLVAITATDIDRFINAPDKRGYSTRNAQRAGLAHFFRFCTIQGWCRNLVELVPVKAYLLSHAQKEPKQRRAFTPDEFARLLAAANADKDSAYWYPAMLIARHTGLRWGDVTNLEWDCVNLGTKRIIVWTDKRDRRVDLQIVHELVELFEALERNGPCVLPPMYPSEINAGWPRIVRAAGLEHTGLCRHGLRHTYATELLKSGLAIDEIRKRLGHFSSRTTALYLH